MKRRAAKAAAAVFLVCMLALLCTTRGRCTAERSDSPPASVASRPAAPPASPPDRYGCSVILDADGKPKTRYGKVQLPAVALPKDRDSFFREDGVTNTEYYHFRSDGTYRMFSREHMGISDWDKGRWQQASDGRITLDSDMRSRDLKAGPFTIGFFRPDDLQQLEAFASVIRATLPRGKFPFKTRPFMEYCMKRFWLPVEVEAGVEEIGQDDLRILAEEIDVYLADEDKNKFFLTPVKYKNDVVLLFENLELPWNRSADSIVETIESEEEYRRLTGHSWPPPVFFAVSKELFDAESGKRQSFRYFPEMND